MNYPLEILKMYLKEIEDAKEWCLKNNNKEDFELINKEKSMPLKSAIWLLELELENKLIIKK